MTGCGKGLVVMEPDDQGWLKITGPEPDDCGVADCGSEWRILLIALCGEEVGIVVHERAAGANHRLARSGWIEGEADIGGELPGRVLGELLGNAFIAVVEDAGGRVRDRRS